MDIGSRLKLPVGIENFEEIRKEGFYYIDKTRLIEQLLMNWGKVNLFTHPRRFGVGYSDTIENYGMLLAPVLTVKAVVLGFVLTWITYELSLFLQKRKISRIDMVEALKENNRNE